MAAPEPRARIPVTRVVLERARDGRSAACGSLAEANAVLARWSRDSLRAAREPGTRVGGEDAGDTGAGSASDTAYCVVYWADGTRLVARYPLGREAEAGAEQADLGAVVRAQCAYGSGRGRPESMSPADYQSLIGGAGQRTVERYERMLDKLEM